MASVHRARSKHSPHSWNVPPERHTRSITRPIRRSPRLAMPSATVADGSCHLRFTLRARRVAPRNRSTLRWSSRPAAPQPEDDDEGRKLPAMKPGERVPLDRIHADHSQLDLSASFQVNAGAQVFLEVINLTNECFCFYRGDSSRPEQQEWYSRWGHVGVKLTDPLAWFR